jgi:hypothetical protein
MSDSHTRRIRDALLDGQPLSARDQRHLSTCADCRRVANRFAEFDQTIRDEAAAMAAEAPLPADPLSSAPNRPVAFAPMAGVALAIIACAAVTLGAFRIAGVELAAERPSSAAASPTRALASSAASPTAAHSDTLATSAGDCQAPPEKRSSGPANKRRAPSRSVRPIGAVAGGYAVAFTLTTSSSLRTWYCWLDRGSTWHLVPQPDGGSQPSASPVTDGHVIAAHDVGDESTPADDRIIITSPAAPPSVVQLSSAGDADWLDDWAFWGDLEPLPTGGFLLAGGDRLATILNGELRFQALPAGLEVVAPTSDPDMWFVRPLSSRAPGRPSAPIEVWRAGEERPTRIANVLERDPERASTGLGWLRIEDSWVLVERSLRESRLPPDGSDSFYASISPDGSSAYAANPQCGAGDRHECTAAFVDPRDGSLLLSLSGAGQLRWV